MMKSPGALKGVLMLEPDVGHAICHFLGGKTTDICRASCFC